MQKIGVFVCHCGTNIAAFTIFVRNIFSFQLRPYREP